MLPAELLQQAFFLHALATEPHRVLPPNKSLLAMMARAPPSSNPSPLHARLEHVVHKAFWDEVQARISLSSPSPSVQLTRLKLLYTDLRDALLPLFPEQHPILLTLAAPLAPTSSPLQSTRAFLNDVLLALRKRCAPVRDPEIDALLQSIASPLSPLPALIVDTLRDIIALADVLRRDLTNSLLGVMSDSQLTDVIRQQARTREREIVLDEAMWASQENINQLWTTWLDDDPSWTSRVIRALVSETPVTCQPADSHPNSLPPQLFFSQPTLLYLQNYLQALVVAASLKSLVRLPPETTHDFVSRVWTLLKAEVDRDDTLHQVNPTQDQDDATKLVNLADEVIRAQSFSSLKVSENDERDLRAAVERTLRLQDPVFALLQGRLVRAIDQRVSDRLNPAERTVGIPETMRTGRGGTPSSRVESRKQGSLAVGPAVKGFEDDVLVQAIDEAVQKLYNCVEWVTSVWQDTMGSL